MEKTRIGISAGLFGALLYFSGLLSGLLLTTLLAVYVLLFEENKWLKRMSIRAVTVVIAFSLLNVIVGFVPEFIDLINYICNVFGSQFSLPALLSIVNVFQEIIQILKDILLIVLGVKALNQRTLAIPVIDGLLDRYI